MLPEGNVAAASAAAAVFFAIFEAPAAATAWGMGARGRTRAATTLRKHFKTDNSTTGRK